MSVTLDQRRLIKRIGLDRAEVCAILDLCRDLLRDLRKHGQVKRRVRTVIKDGGYRLDQWNVESDPLLQKLNEIDDATESALLSGLEVLEKHLPQTFDDEFKTNFNSVEFDEPFSLSGFECPKP
jgi:hypothetical protein